MLFRLLPAICFVAMLCGIVLSIAVVRIGDVHVQSVMQYSGVQPIHRSHGLISIDVPPR